MSHPTITFENERGLALAAREDVPARGTPRAWALFAHCFTCTRNVSAVRRIARALTDQGIAVLSFDFTGLGDSEGEFAETGFASQAADLLSAVDYLRRTHGQGPAIMIGHSLGGTATLYAARKVEEVKGVATIGSPADPAHVTKLFECDLEEIERTGEARVSIGGRPFSVRRELVDDMRSHPPAEWLSSLRSNVLLFHSPVDTIVGIENAATLYEALRHPKSFVSLNRADHLLSDQNDARHVARVIAAWADSFLPEATETGQAAANVATGGASPTPGADWQVAAHIGRTPYEVRMSNGRHHPVADEPQSVGGGDRGGNPFDYLLWSLAACTVMTVRMYADRKGWPLESVVARLVYKKVAAEDAGLDPARAAARKGQATVITIALELEGSLDEAQHARLIEMAHRCPVHRTLVGPVRIDVVEAGTG